MEHHPYFDLWLHTDSELAALLPSRLVERTTLHEWPLSCVQRLILKNGQKAIYKAQYHEGVEVDFYQQVQAPLLPDSRYLGAYQNTDALILEYIDAPRLDQLSLSEAEIYQHGLSLAAAIRQIPGPVPVYADLSSPAQWDKYVRQTLAKLTRLVETRQFQRIRPAIVERLEAWACSESVVRVVGGPSGLAHADLSGANVFLTPAGYRVIDWQYPRMAPAGFDLACFMDAMGCDPYRYVAPEVVDILWFVRLAWFVECKTRLFPEGDKYDLSVDQLAEKILLEK